jgi:thioredoxin reductase (NADPH)
VANTLVERRRGQMFPKLTAAQLARLERQGTRLKTHAGEILQELGEISRGVFVVAAGSVEALVPPSVTQAESTYELLYLLTPGDFTGEMSTLRGTRVLARIRVREAGAVLLIDADQLRRIVQNDAELSELFMRAFILRRMGVIESGRSEVLLPDAKHPSLREHRHRA